MKSQSIVNSRAIEAKSDQDIFEKLLLDYRPFIYSQVKKTVGHTYIDEHDDAASIGMIAFYEAIQYYNPENGYFLPFASIVIRRRVIDHMRKNFGAGSVAISEEPYDDIADTPEPTDGFEEVIEQLALREEIERLNNELFEWGITMEDVYKDSPRHKARRDMIWQVIADILADKDCLDTLLQKRYLPLKKILKTSKLPRKNLENSRRYIVSCILIASGDYPLIRKYLDLGK